MVHLLATDEMYLDLITHLKPVICTFSCTHNLILHLF
jgi:hypothetical protein